MFWKQIKDHSCAKLRIEKCLVIFGTVFHSVVMYLTVYSVLSLVFCVVSSERRSIERTAVEKLQTDINEIKYRLPNNTKPINYDITLITNIDKNEFNFSGVAVISLQVLETSANITLHARQLTIKSVKLTTLSGIMIRLNPSTYDVTTEFLTIPTQNLYKDMNYVLTIEYSGELRTDQFGFYRSSYVNSNGETKQVQFLFKQRKRDGFLKKK